MRSPVMICLASESGVVLTRKMTAAARARSETLLRSGVTNSPFITRCLSSEDTPKALITWSTLCWACAGLDGPGRVTAPSTPSIARICRILMGTSILVGSALGIAVGPEPGDGVGQRFPPVRLRQPQLAHG